MINYKFISPHKKWLSFIEADVAKSEEVAVKINELEKKIKKILDYSNTCVFLVMLF